MADPTPWIVAEDTGAVRKHAPATLRNREVIAEVLDEVLPRDGLILEIASGSGEHCAYFAERIGREWQPSDPDPTACASIAAWTQALANVRAPLSIDAAGPEWPIARADAVLCINMVHISPWDATLGLLAGAARILPPGGPLILYGPFVRDGVETAPSNLAFDASLRARDAAWGLRQLEDVTAAARECGFDLAAVSELPANNVAVAYRRLA